MSTREIQDLLEAALEKARGARDRTLAAQVREEGERFARGLLALGRLSHTHQADNLVFRQPSERCAAALGALASQLGSVHLVVLDEQVYVNDVRVRFEGLDDAAGRLEAWLQPHDAGGFSFHRALDAQELQFLRNLHGPVAVGVGRDDGKDLDPAGQGAPENLKVMRQCVEVDLEPGVARRRCGLQGLGRRGVPREPSSAPLRSLGAGVRRRHGEPY